MRAYSGGYIGGKPTQNRLISPGVWTMEEASELRRNAVWPTADAQDPAYDNTVLLLHGDGADNGTVFTDSSPVATSITAIGDIITSTTTQKFGTASIRYQYLTTLHLHLNGTEGSTTMTNSALGGANWGSAGGAIITTADSKFGGSSLYLNGTTAYITRSSASEFAVGTNDFTVEFWCKLDPTPGIENPSLTFAGGTTQALWNIKCNRTTGRVTFSTPIAGGPNLTSITGIRDNAWHHVAVSRNDLTTRLFIDGQLEASAISLTKENYTYGNTTIRIGSSNAAGDFEKGYFDEFRLTNGLGRYTTSFTVATQAYNDANALQIPTSPNLAFGTGDFTIETWVYSTASQTATIYDGRNGSEPNTIQIHLVSSQPYLAINGTNVITTTTALTTNAWRHLAVCRRNGSTRIFINGVQAGSTYTDANDYVAPSAFATIGSYYDETNRFQGYIDEFRILKNSGVYTSAFVPSSYPYGDTQIDDPYFNYGTLLLPLNSDFTDSSYLSNEITASGNVVISATQSQTGGASAYFDGSNAYLGLANSTSNIISSSSGDFTLEFWFLSETNTGDRCLYESYASASSLTGISITDGNLLFYVNTGSGDTALITTTAPVAGSWYYLTLERVSTTINLFIDGGLVGTCVSTGLPTFSSGSVRIGSNNGNTKKFQGYIDELRMTDVLTRYRTPFLRPQYANWYPTPTADNDPSFASVCLLYQFNASPIVESSNNAFAVTSVGSPVISSAANVNRYSGSSLYLDGSSYLSTPESTATSLPNAATIEAWVRPASYATTMAICGKWGIAGGNAWIFRITNANTISLQIGLNGTAGATYSATTPFTLAVNTWYHIVAERWGGYARFFVNGIQAGTVSAFNSSNLSGTGPTYVGSNGGSSEFFTGYIDAIRVTNGVARYSSTKLSAVNSASVFLYRPELSFPNS